MASQENGNMPIDGWIHFPIYNIQNFLTIFINWSIIVIAGRNEGAASSAPKICSLFKESTIYLLSKTENNDMHLALISNEEEI